MIARGCSFPLSIKVLAIAFPVQSAISGVMGYSLALPRIHAPRLGFMHQVQGGKHHQAGFPVIARPFFAVAVVRVMRGETGGDFHKFMHKEGQFFRIFFQQDCAEEVAVSAPRSPVAGPLDPIPPVYSFRIRVEEDIVDRSFQHPGPDPFGKIFIFLVQFLPEQKMHQRHQRAGFGAEKVTGVEVLQPGLFPW